MAVIPSYPGVYIEELSSGVRSVAALPTSIAAFVGRALRGPTDSYDVPDQVPTVVNSYADYERIFGGLWTESSMSYAVRDFFRNGGGQALIVRLFQAVGQSVSRIVASTPVAGSPLNLISATPGSWGNRLRVTIDHATRDTEPGETSDSLFNLKIELIPDTGVASLQQLPDLGTRVEEIYANVTCLPGLPHSLDTVLLNKSKLMRVELPATTAARPDTGTVDVTVMADDGTTLGSTNFTGSEAARTGIYALLKADLFNILCIPPYLPADTPGGDVHSGVISAAAKLCRDRRAFLILDANSEWDEISDAVSGVNQVATDVGTDNARNAAVFFPRLQMPNPLRQNQMETFASCGAVAGVFARTDVQRGVWKAPAGLDAGLAGTSALSVPMTDAENGQLNPLGVNCLRAMPGTGPVIWGSRTLRGADRLADTDWKYIPVRRLALFLEESIFRGTQWAVFEPNDEPLWSQLRMNIGAFLHTLFRQGAFQGSSPREAYFVKCDRSTTTQTDINNGIVNILIGYAPLKPAEFVILKFQQMAGQVQS
jgi:phage tail sheath protein FI